MAANRYPGTCANCGQRVEAGAGWSVRRNGQFVVVHQRYGCPVHPEARNAWMDDPPPEIDLDDPEPQHRRFPGSYAEEYQEPKEREEQEHGKN